MRRPFILSVDDKELNRYLRGQHLSAADFEYAEAASGAEAIARVLRDRPDLVLLDINLPDADGTDICRLIKTDPRTKGTMVLQISASAVGIADAVRGLEGGADGYLIEPVEPELLIAHIRSLLRLRDSEQALKLSEERLQIALDAARMGTFEWLVKPDVLNWSDTVFELFGVRPSEFNGTLEGFYSYVHPDDVARVRRIVNETLHSRDDYHAEYRIRRSDGALRWIWVRGRLFRSEDGRPERLAGVVMDVTERKQSEQALQQANEDLQQFAFSAGHDLQAPLRTVRIFAELLDKELGESATGTIREHLDRVLTGAERMQSMIGSLLSYARAGQVPAGPPPCTSLENALAEAIRSLGGAIEESGAQVTADPLPVVPAWADQITQVFQNLLMNAITYRRSEEAPRIAITASLYADCWTISIRDNGQGFEPEHAEEIFGLLKRLHGQDVAGTGLGLAICRRIIERHGGSIWAEGRPGQGAAFHFSLPAVQVDAQDIPVKATTPATQ